MCVKSSNKCGFLAYLINQSIVVFDFKQLSSGTLQLNDPITIRVLCCIFISQCKDFILHPPAPAAQIFILKI